MPDPFFHASKLCVGYCADPSCRALHIQMLDGEGEPRAQAVFACEDVELLVADLRKVRDVILGGHASLERH